MSVVTKTPAAQDHSLRLLNGSAKAWFFTAVAGQLMFVFHILYFYGGSTVRGDFAAWNEVLYHGIISGDTMGNVALGIHLLLAAVITLGGPIQLVPWIQKNMRQFHRWNGRVYVVTAIIISLSGLYIIYARGAVVGPFMGAGNTLNALMIMVCAVMTMYFAMNRRLDVHRRWALRLFLAVSGVWFFRVGFGLWILINQGAPGHTDAFDGPFDIFLAFGHALIPIAILELYLRVKDKGKPIFRKAMTLGLVLLTALMAGGIFMATIIFWLPGS
ncbi:DUF2306 domain-containing protein [Marinoscillum sp.]|uniref:DUF2306 domain-containing protein n=1 Tax=Marinoscillum sp. TaxID=2024838 RepID=UPI003BA8F70A